MLAEEIPVEGIRISFCKQQSFPCKQWAEFFLASQQGISHMGEEQDLPCSLIENLLEFGQSLYRRLFSCYCGIFPSRPKG